MVMFRIELLLEVEIDLEELWDTPLCDLINIDDAQMITVSDS